MPLRWNENAHNSERGAGLAEYAFLLALIALVVIGALTTLGVELTQSFVNTTAALFP